MTDSLGTEAFLVLVLVQLIVIIAAARLGGLLAARLGQPQVVGEIAAGLLLGPSCLGRISPASFEFVFGMPETDPVFRVLGQLGLVFLMFLIGLEFEFGHLRRLGASAARVALAGLLLPFLLGAALAGFIHPYVAPEVPRTAFVLFIATALSITAVPILGRILVEFGMTRTRLGVLAITAAAVDDAIGWILLAAVSATVAGSGHPAKIVGMLGLAIGFVVMMGFLVRPVMERWSARVLRDPEGFGVGPLSILLLVILASALLTNLIGIFSIFGSFVLGAVLFDQHELRKAVGARLWDFVNAFFLPVFFTYTGLKTDIRMLDTPFLWLVCGLVILTAMAGKLIGCGLAARLGGLSWRESAAVAVLMNTRALMALVVINVGRELGVIPDSVFCMLVIMALATTFMTSPALRWLIRDPADAPQASAG